MGNGPRGLQPERRRVGATSPTTRRGRAPTTGERTGSRVLRPEAATVFRPGALEREGPDPEGAALRLEQCRREPRRGREGVLLLSRLHADPLVHEVALQISPGGLSRTTISWRRTARRSREELEYELIDTGVFDQDRYFDVVAEYAEVLSGGVLRPDHRRRTAARRPRRFICCPACGSATRGAGGRTRRNRTSSAAKKGRRRERRGGVSPGARRSLAVLRRRAAAAVHRERHQYRRGSSTRPTRLLTSRTPSTRSWSTGKPMPSTRRRPAPRPPLTTVSRSAPASRWRSGCASRIRRHKPGPFAAFDKTIETRRQRGGRVLSILHAGVGQRGHRARHAPGLRRPLLDQAVLLLRRQHVAPRARRGPVPRPGRLSGQEP